MSVKIVEKYSFTTQKKYIDFLNDPKHTQHSAALNFIIENIPGEEFLAQCLDNTSNFKEIESLMQEVMGTFHKRTGNTHCPLEREVLSKYVNMPVLKTELVLMKIFYPEKYNQLINSPEFFAVLWNRENSALSLLNKIKHDLPITPTSIAGLEVSKKIMANRYNDGEINGNKANSFNLSKDFQHIKMCLPDYTQKFGYTYKIDSKADGGTKISLINPSGKVELIFENEKFNKNNIGILTQHFYDNSGKEIGSLIYESSGNVFNIRTSSGTKVLRSLKDFQQNFPNLHSKLSREVWNYIFINDDGYQTRLQMK